MDILPGMTGCRILNGRIDPRVRPEVERVIIPCQFKIVPGLNIIGQSQFAVSPAKLQIGILRINLRGLLILGERFGK